MSFGISNFDSLPASTKLAFEDLEAWVNAFLLKEHNPDGTHGNITAVSVAGPAGLNGAPGTSGTRGLDGASGTSPNGQQVQLISEDSGHRWLRGPWLFDKGGNDSHVAGLRPAIITANKNDFLPQGFDSAVILELESDAARTITGLQRFGRNKRMIVIGNRGNHNITLAHNSSSSVYWNRFSLPSSVDLVLASGQYAWLYYDVGSEIWRCLITPQSSGGLATMTSGAWTTLVKPSDQDNGQGNITPAVDTFLTVPLTANKTYAIRGYLLLESSGDGVSGGMTIQLDKTTATLGLQATFYNGAVTTLGADTIDKSLPATMSAAATNSASLAGMAWFHSTIIVTGTGGSFDIKYASLNSGGTWKAIVKKGSYVEYASI